jgi:hypothetical protein
MLNHKSRNSTEKNNDKNIEKNIEEKVKEEKIYKPKYLITFPGQTNPKEKICENPIWFESFSVFPNGNKQDDKINQFGSLLSHLLLSAIKITIVPADFLNRFNFEMLSGDKTEAEKDSRNLGPKWLKDRSSHLDELKYDKNAIKYWEEFLKHPIFELLLYIADNLSKINGFKKAFDKANSERVSYINALKYDDFIDTLASAFEEDSKKVIEKINEYLLEEFTVVLLVRYLQENDALIYNGKLNAPTEKAATATIQFELIKALTNDERFVELCKNYDSKKTPEEILKECLNKINEKPLKIISTPKFIQNVKKKHTRQKSNENNETNEAVEDSNSNSDEDKDNFKNSFLDYKSISKKPNDKLNGKEEQRIVRDVTEGFTVGILNSNISKTDKIELLNNTLLNLISKNKDSFSVTQKKN